MLPLFILIAVIGVKAYTYFDMFDDSARAALLKLVYKKLDAFYSINGQYPSSFKDLEITEYPDGGSEKTLRSIKYSINNSNLSVLITYSWMP